MADLRIALAGNPNAGKTSLFNALTGARQHVGNYPGVTVEERWGEFRFQGKEIHVADLPGTYSLSSFSPEERVARNELVLGKHDVVVVVADSTALKRSLMLLVQVMQLGAKPVLCLNMADEAKNAGQRVNTSALEAKLGFPVVETAAHRGQGKTDVMEAVLRAAASESPGERPKLGATIDEAIERIAAELQVSDDLSHCEQFLATRLLVGDDKVGEVMTDALRRRGGSTATTDDNGFARAQELADKERARIDEESGSDTALLVTESYFAFVDGLILSSLETPARADARKRSEAIDRILVHKWLGLPIFSVIMYAIFWVTFSLGEYPMDWIDQGTTWLANVVSGFWSEGSESLLRSLLVEGVIAGVGGVVIFLPNILLLFFGLALLEDTGYMARAAFVMDRVMHRFGLHGKSFVPMVTGFGCNIPGIMATRTLENERDRLTTMMILPLMSCGARMPIWMLLIPAFFAPQWRAPALWGIYAIGIILALAMALLLRKSVLKGAEAPFVMELPPYRWPTKMALVKKMTERGWIYLRKAGTVILSVSIVLWFLAAFPKKDSYEVDKQLATGAIELSQEEVEQARASEDLRHSYAGRMGVAMEPAIAPMGFDWRLGTSLIGAFAAKEVFVANMGIVYAMDSTDEPTSALRDRLSADYSPLVGFSLMLFLLIATPCMATFAVTKRESGSWKWGAAQFFGLTLLGYILSTLVYQIGRMF